MDKKIATIQDVARAAGVSIATVSRTLSKPSVVSKATQTSVLQAVADTGYRINTTASNLRRQRTGSIIALVPNLANPFFSQILAGLSSVLTQVGFGLLIADTQSGTDPDERLAHYLASGMADGLILFDGTLSRKVLDQPRRLPVIMACEWMPGSLPSITADNRAGAELAVNHLVEYGHHDIGYIAGPVGNVLNIARQDAFVESLTKHSLSVQPDWIYEGDFSMDAGAAAARRWMAMTNRPTALFCASDEMAVGFIGEVQNLGAKVPDDVSVVGFDNIEVGQHITPALTTIRQPRKRIGERAAHLLLDMISASSTNGPSEVVDIEFISRASVARPAT